MGTNRWSGIVERKRNETDAKAGDGLAAEDKGGASSRLQASEGPKENEEKREAVKKLKTRESWRRGVITGRSHIRERTQREKVKSV